MAPPDTRIVISDTVLTTWAGEWELMATELDGLVKSLNSPAALFRKMKLGGVGENGFVPGKTVKDNLATAVTGLTGTLKTSVAEPTREIHYRLLWVVDAFKKANDLGAVTAKDWSTLDYPPPTANPAGGPPVIPTP